MSRQSDILMSQIAIASWWLLLLSGVMSDALDLLELIVSHLGGLADLVIDLTLEFLGWGLADVRLLLSDSLDAGQVLTELELAFLSGLLALLVSEELLMLRLLKLLLSLLVDGTLSLKSKTTTLLSNTRRNRTNTVLENFEAFLSSTVELLLDVALSDGWGLRICLEALLDLWGFSWWRVAWTWGELEDAVSNSMGCVLFLLEDLGNGWSRHHDVCKRVYWRCEKVENF